MILLSDRRSHQPDLDYVDSENNDNGDYAF
jgi:hypothetical protein